MKFFKFIALIGALIIGSESISASLVLDGTSYEVDSIFRREVGPGIFHTRFRIPDYPLNVYTIEMDMKNPYNTIETNLPNNTLGTQERLADAYVRHQAEGKYPIAGANASFWVVTGHGEGWAFMLGTNFGGCVLNGKILTETNAHNNLAYLGRGVIGVDTDKKIWANSMSWYGEAKCSKWDKNLEIIQFNKVCNEGELAVFTQENGKTKPMLTNATNDNIFFDIDEGQTWGVNKDMTATVKAITLDKAGEAVGEYDFCLTGSGAYKQYLRQLQIGDKITINHAWTINGTNIKPDFNNLVEGNVSIMKDGELTPDNDNDGYCSQVYSRCGYGASKDGDKLFIMVIDMSTNEYGYSKGCPSRIMSQILKEMGCWNAVNMDAGGSAQMMVGGSVINKTTEGTPRAVSTSWLLYSTAPRSSEITRLEFDDFNLKMPTNALFTPKMLGYNQYGDLVDEDVQGVTFSCSENLGKCEGNIMYANNAPGYGTLTANYNGIEVTRPLTTLSTAMSLRIKPTILIDGHRDYPVEISSTINRKEYLYDPSIMTWEIEDPTVVQIVNGVMKGLKNGETKIRCSNGDFSDESVVKVEIPNAPSIGQDWSRWSLKGTGASNVSVDAQGALKFNYTGGRVASVKMSNETPFYSLPDKIEFEFTSTIPIEYITIDLRNATMTAPNNLKCMNGTVRYEAGETYHVDFDLSQLGDMKDLMNYPISAPSMTFYLPTTGIEKEEKTINIKKFDGVYNNYSSVGSIEKDNGNSIRLYPNPITDGILNVGSTFENVNISIFNSTGVLVYQSNVAVNSGVSTIDLSFLDKGFYFVSASNAEVNKVQKIIIK